jgi:hypothetical protein
MGPIPCLGLSWDCQQCTGIGQSRDRVRICILATSNFCRRNKYELRMLGVWLGFDLQRRSTKGPGGRFLIERLPAKPLMRFRAWWQ